MKTREAVLRDAMDAVLKDRQAEYGPVEDSFSKIAQYWSAHLDIRVTPTDVAVMMSLLKVARAGANPSHTDNWIDLAGYAACGAECATRSGS